MEKLESFTMIGRGKTPEEAFEDVKNRVFVREVKGKEYMVFVETPKSKKPFKHITELLDTNPFLRDKNGPVGCVLARAAGWVDERHVVGREAESEVVYLVYNAKGKELFSCPDEKQAIKKGRQWASENGVTVSVQKQIRITEKIIECQALPENHLNSYWFFGWAMA